MVPSLPILLLLALAWAAWTPLAWFIASNPRGDVPTGFAVIVNWFFTRFYHRLSVVGAEHVPPRRLPPAKTDRPDFLTAPVGATPSASPVPPPRGLVVICNHTAGLDPLLIQSVCPFYIRWMMATEMRVKALEPLWRWLEIIFVGADGARSGASELAALKDVLRDLKAGGVIGIFPEGRLERPAQVIHPFQPGVGVLIARSGAEVLPMVVSGTAYCPHAWGSFYRPGRARLRVMPRLDYTGQKAGDIVADLQAKYLAWTGWPLTPPDPALSRVES